MSLLGQEDDSTVFRCPRCSQFISSQLDACRFCDLPITEEMKDASAAAVFEENKTYRIGFHKNILILGVVLFAVGFLMLGSFALSMLVKGEGSFFYISPLLVLAGLGQIILGLHGIYKEKRSKLNRK